MFRKYLLLGLSFVGDYYSPKVFKHFERLRFSVDSQLLELFKDSEELSLAVPSNRSNISKHSAPVLRLSDNADSKILMSRSSLMTTHSHLILLQRLGVERQTSMRLATVLFGNLISRRSLFACARRVRARATRKRTIRLLS